MNDYVPPTVRAALYSYWRARNTWREWNLMNPKPAFERALETYALEKVDQDELLERARVALIAAADEAME